MGDGAVAPGAIGDSVASVFAAFDLGRALVGAKDDAIWAWLLVPQGRPTRLVTRLRTGPISHRSGGCLGQRGPPRGGRLPDDAKDVDRYLGTGRVIRGDCPGSRLCRIAFSVGAGSLL